ncbi:hypothetical protein, partial [Staphylococcus epidermidis]|uniref:hypothetical protein n=1 Tax=Staphylococcus epidermidis TaxID=1282 RepID=UPI001C92F707
PRTSIPLTAQHTQTPTFTHTHPLLHHQQNPNTFTPFHHLPQQHPTFHIHNSPLSQPPLLPFHYPYNVENKPNF